ncbi:hypothetical protein HY29_03065 [Hyphomonas beringensis]|uniref:Peptidase M56 domain-containing protein n=1 Tax=Hyphomonas beringensis TaxID=1280946 RepID=A0A062U183_9PROT|nr:M56 family metallopeptidase [Hyphomonas beringensis]KCZ54066.1 hypothetical protein HY29_03065 [Hyphomonas beringensis]
MITALNTFDTAYAVQTVIAVSVLFALVLASRQFIARQFGAGVAYALWAIPVIRLILPPISSPVSLPGLQGISPASSLAMTGTPGDAPAIVHSPEVNGSTFQAIPAPPAPEITSTHVVTHSTESGSTGLADLMSFLTDGVFWTFVLTLWAGGAIYMMTRSWLAHHTFMQTLRREEQPASPALQALAEDVARQVGLKRMPQIATSFISSGPLVSGLLRPTVLLPAWFEQDYSHTQQRAALAHELTHVKRADLWALQVSEIVVACLWFNPLAYYARRAFRTDQEAACDSDVLNSGAATPHAYGQTLLKAVQITLPERLTAAASLPLTHALKERMIRMTNPTPSRSRRLMGAGLAGILGSAALVVTACTTATAEEQTTELAGDSTSESLMLESGTVYINGKKVEDRQIVLLRDPMEGHGLPPGLDDEIKTLTVKIEAETAELEKVLAEMPALELDFAGLDEDLKSKIEFAFEFDEENMPKTDEEWEAWSKKIEEQAKQWEVHAEVMSARAEAISDRVEARTEAWVDRMEPRIEEIQDRIEAHADELEERIEREYGDDFHASIEGTHLALTDLVEECKDAKLSDGETRIMEKVGGKAHDGKPLKVKIACVKGGPETLTTSSTMNAVMSNPKLDEKEKETFRKKAEGKSKSTWKMKTESRTSHTED